MDSFLSVGVAARPEGTPRVARTAARLILMAAQANSIRTTYGVCRCHGHHPTQRLGLARDLALSLLVIADAALDRALNLVVEEASGSVAGTKHPSH
jgi:hypothetical protein